MLNLEYLTDTLNRINIMYGRGDISKIVLNNQDNDFTPTKGQAFLKYQYGAEVKDFHLYTHGNGKMGVSFRGNYRIIKQTK